LQITGFIWLEHYVEKLAWKHDVNPEDGRALILSARNMDDAEKRRHGRK
jgi:hypothetical protein